MKKFDVTDVLILAGAAGVLVGVGMIYIPAAVIIAGIGLLLLGLRGHTGGNE